MKWRSPKKEWLSLVMTFAVLASPALGDEPLNPLNAKDFAVPRHAFGNDITLTTFAGGIHFKCRAFESWLERNKEFGARVALNDPQPASFLERRDMFSDEDPIPEVERPENTYQNHRLKTRPNIADARETKAENSGELRVSDLAYCVLHKKHGLPPISYRDSIAVRNQRIQALLALLDAVH